jgi:hypothetical protein
VGASGCAAGVRVGRSLWPAVTLNGGSECPARARSPMTMAMACCWSVSLLPPIPYPHHSSYTAPHTRPHTTAPIPPIQPYRPFCAPIRAPAAKILTTSPTGSSTRIAQLTHLTHLRCRPLPSWPTTPPTLSPHPPSLRHICLHPTRPTPLFQHGRRQSPAQGHDKGSPATHPVSRYVSYIASSPARTR